MYNTHIGTTNVTKKSLRDIPKGKELFVHGVSIPVVILDMGIDTKNSAA
jgi:hypothetical protein